MLNKYTVVLDAGHGGTKLKDGSTPNNSVGPNGLLEKDVTLKIAKIAGSKLNSKGFKAILTRRDDTNISLAERAERSREEGADVFVSIHLNGSRDSNVDGTELYVSSGSDDRDYRLASKLLQNLSKTARTKPKGICVSDFTVLKGEFHVAKTAACLLEIAYLTNPRQAEKLSSEAYLEELADAVAQSVLSHAKHSSIAQSLPRETHEKMFIERAKEHKDAKNFPIDLPEPAKGTDVFPVAIPSGLKFSRWEIEVLSSTSGAGYKVADAPRSGAEGTQNITVNWWHLPYGKINYKLKVYASPDGKIGTATKVVYNSPGWMEKAKDQISQDLPVSFVVKGENAKRLNDAIQKEKAKSKSGLATEKAIALEGITVAVVIVLIIAAVVVVGMIVLGSIIKMALDKGYDVEDTKYKAGVGEGSTRQEHEFAFNLMKPKDSGEKSAEQSLGSGYFGDSKNIEYSVSNSDVAGFQPLD